MCVPADESYRKDRLHPPGHGYGRAVRANVYTAARAAPPTSIIVHATHGRAGSATASEAAFLRDSADVSAHYLIGRDGALYRILPDDAVAWHAGTVAPGYTNEQSIGIELHAAATEPITPAQRARLADTLRALMARYHISPAQIATHRAAALPPGRKSDPATWQESDFRTWVAALDDAPAPGPAYTAGSPILGGPPVAPSAVLGHIQSRAPHGEYTAYDVREIVLAYLDICAPAGVDPVVALAQMGHETSWLRSWWAQRPRRNPAGIGVDGRTAPAPDGPAWAYDGASGLWRAGVSFPTWANDSVPAHVGRLLAYALRSGEETPAQRALIEKALRYRPLPPALRGSAPTLKALGAAHNPTGQGWASPGDAYGEALARMANWLVGP
jgi:hypothetical protein